MTTAAMPMTTVREAAAAANMVPEVAAAAAIAAAAAPAVPVVPAAAPMKATAVPLTLKQSLTVIVLACAVVRQTIAVTVTLDQGYLSTNFFFDVFTKDSSS